MTGASAEIVLDCRDLAPALGFFQDLGFQLDLIFPADAPTTAVISGHGLRLRLAPGQGGPGELRLPAAEGRQGGLTAPNGTRITFVEVEAPLAPGMFEPAFHLVRASEAAPAAGRAGMLYRDLIPSRLGGRYIASHITLPDGGPLSDWVHYHRIGSQFLVCRRGWARVVYEDQGPPFRFEAGDCILQPPLIRHRVLESSAGFEVIEIASPALHETLADHDLDLPNERLDPDRDFSGQRFLHDRASEGRWRTMAGCAARDLGLAAASAGRVHAKLLRAGQGVEVAHAPGGFELTFGFVMEGRAILTGGDACSLGPADAFVIPPGDPWTLEAASDDFEGLLVTA